MSLDVQLSRAGTIDRGGKPRDLGHEPASSRSTVPREVVAYFARHHEMSMESAHEVFSELECFLGLAADGPVRPSQYVDEAWHDFILHTRDYAEYCRQRFGRFIHHVPDPVGLHTPEDDAEAYCKSCSSNCHRG